MTYPRAAVRSLLLLTSLAFAGSALAQRDLKDIPDPDPELERATFIVADGFEVNLYAGDPMLAKPIQMNFDGQGRLWIASSETYPHIKPGEKPIDKILVLEDADADGRADKTTVFADGLLIPTGVLPGDGGCYVANSTELLHLADTDNDGKADKQRVVLSGFGTEDTHHLLHTLRWGVDGSLYMNQSIYIHSHVETPQGVKRLNGGGIWRFRPDTLQLDVFCRGFVNPWGHHQDQFGQSFATDGAYGEGINYVFPGAIYVTAPGEKRRLEGLNPGSPKHCGLEIVSGRHVPPEWVGNMLTNDFRAHRVCRFVVTEDGSGYASRQEVEVIKSTHVAFRPIDVKMGPDGAIYIADWYNPIIQHGEVDFRDPRRDHVHGRIWRVSAKGRALVERQKIVGAPIEDLLDMLLAPEAWTRLWAKQELKTRDHQQVFAALEKWIAAKSKSWAFFDNVMLEIEWLYQTMNSQSETPPQHLLTSAVPQIRAAAVRLASDVNDRAPVPLEVFAAAVRDEHPRVRLEGVRALAKVPSAKAAELAATALDRPMDRFLDFALWQTMRDLEPYWLPALQKGEVDFGGDVGRLTFALSAVDAPQIAGLLLKRFAAGE
ncbi:MAG: sorbosone dehydrogenase, partial [Planctomycetales bacterium]|nr:sorbosone dehydrogenase [Planctomycetales bacterium]